MSSPGFARSRQMTGWILTCPASSSLVLVRRHELARIRQLAVLPLISLASTSPGEARRESEN
ncbi:hypothetical protein A2U01_0100519 [Trifolium medium]|uniref:Uncharacterized protein n=1 Tax=Trifolium medium TaxID=97028 RepID=A0A392UT88_9FABA|nr:hypothetical protein [Trifolium medium]